MMPAGEAVIKVEGKTLLVGDLSYSPISTVLCSVCQESESAVAKASSTLR